MNRVFALILLALLLCGCAATVQEETTVPPVPAATRETEPPTEPRGSYLPKSSLAAATGGALRCYQPEIEDMYGIRTIGEDVLIFSGMETTTLTRLTGEKLYTVARTELDCLVDPEDTSFQLSANGITYYSPENKELVFLGNDLKEVRRVSLPEGLVGEPVLSADRSLVYYCTADAVRVHDLTTGLDKLLKSISYADQRLEAALLDDTVLRCDLTDERGSKSVIFLSSRTGELLGEMTADLVLTSAGGYYYGQGPEGALHQVLFGKEDTSAQVLYPRDPFAPNWVLEEIHSAVTSSENGETTTLDHYDLTTGLCTASLELPGSLEPRDMEPQENTGNVYVLLHDNAEGTMFLGLWNCGAAAAADATIYTGPRYSAENYDEEGIARCAALAQSIGQTHGVKILVGPEAAAEQPWDYSLEMEYQVSLLQRELERIREALEQFPDGFFEKIHGQIHICIVRSITGTAESGSVAKAQGVQFWSGDNAYVVLAAGENLQQSFFHEMFHVIDGKVLSSCRVYYYWHNLNPEGCGYFEDYTSYLTADVEKYLEDENRAFIDAYSMCYPREDRARVMEYACMEGNAHYFESQIMQSKLKTLCEGIRKAFRLEKYQGSFLWEQYLAEPLKMK